MRRGAFLGLLFILSLPCAALGQDTPAPAASSPATAREAFRRGEAAYSAGNYEAAVREWTNAYAVDPRPRIQFNLSQAYERMGDLESAIGALKRFIESGDPEDPTYSDANARLVALQQRLASTGVMVQGGPEGGSILVDGEDWGRTPRPDKITVKPGNHVIVVRWPDGREYRTNVYVPPGQVVEMQVAESGGVKPAGGAAQASGTAEPQASAGNRRVLWYSLGAGVAAVGIGLVSYGTARFVAKGKCSEDGRYCNPKAEDAAGTQGLAGVISGGALIAGGAALFIVGALKGDGGEERQAKTSCGVGLSRASCTFRF